MKQKILEFASKIVNIVKLKLTSLDTKITTFVPNPKMKKVLYIGVGSLFGLMLLIITIGILLSPFRKMSPTGLILNKPKIETVTVAPQKELNETQKKLLELETRVKDMRFPESNLNIPVIERELSI